MGGKLDSWMQQKLTAKFKVLHKSSKKFSLSYDG